MEALVCWVEAETCSLDDDREPAALLAGPSGLDRGVQRQQVGLLGLAGDRGDPCAPPPRRVWL